jgi:hypothetical protein
MKTAIKKLKQNLALVLISSVIYWTVILLIIN